MALPTSAYWTRRSSRKLEFLNAKARSDPDGNLWNNDMDRVISGASGCDIRRDGEEGNYTYRVAYEETRYMAYSSLTVGGWGGIRWIRNISSPTVRQNVARLHAELRQLFPAFEQSYENPTITVSHNHEGIARDFLTDCISDISTLALEDEQDYYLIVADNSGVFEDVSLRMKLPKIKDNQTRDAQVLNEDWSREIRYDEATAQWVIDTHTMVFGDVNIWVIPKRVLGGETDDP